MASEFYCDKIMEFLNGSGPNSSSATQTNVATLPLDSTGTTTPSISVSLPSIDKPKEPTLVAGERFYICFQGGTFCSFKRCKNS